MGTSTPDITQLLVAWGQGDENAAAALLPAVYAELHAAASRAMRRETPGHTLQTTALVHEAYLRLVDQRRADWRNRAQFYGIAAQMMRRVLVDRARERNAEKRGGGAQNVTLNDDVHGLDDGAAEVLALHEALERLARIDATQARLVELRYFAGLTIEESAHALQMSPATLKREWAVARAWLKRELTDAAS